MSLSDSRPKTNSVTRTGIAVRRGFQLLPSAAKKVMDKAANNPIQFIVLFMVVLTGIAQILRLPLSVWWYVLLFIEISIDFYETNIRKPREIIGRPSQNKNNNDRS